MEGLGGCVGEGQGSLLSFWAGREQGEQLLVLSSPQAATRRGKVVLCNVMIPVQPSGPALILGGCRVGPGSGELRPCSVSSCGGWVGWAADAWSVFIVVEGAVFPSG